MEELDARRAADRSGMQPEVDVARAPAGDQGEALPVEVEGQDGFGHAVPRCAPDVAAGSTCSHRRGRACDAPGGLFVRSGQLLVFHDAILVSSRSRARPTGPCGHKPSCPSRCHTCTVPKWRPMHWVINWRIRATVQNSPAKPAANGRQGSRPLVSRGPARRAALCAPASATATMPCVAAGPSGPMTGAWSSTSEPSPPGPGLRPAVGRLLSGGFSAPPRPSFLLSAFHIQNETTETEFVTSSSYPD